MTNKCQTLIIHTQDTATDAGKVQHNNKKVNNLSCDKSI